jgi:hypothetical protein
MIVAELEVYHSRPVAPTRRVALGHLTLPVDPAPGFGGVLLGGVVARFVGGVDPDMLPDLLRLTLQLENGQRIPQPRLRYRFQKDYVGLQRSTHRLYGAGDEVRFGFDEEHGLPTQQVLGAVYAAAQLPLGARPAVMSTIRRAVGWQGPVGPELIAVLSGFNSGSSLSAQAMANPVEWAMDVLGFEPGRPGGPGPSGAAARTGARANGRSVPGGRPGGTNGANGTNGNGDGHGHSGHGPSKSEVQRRYRRLLIAAHPDHGGEGADAAQRIADLTEARKILLG